MHKNKIWLYVLILELLLFESKKLFLLSQTLKIEIDYKLDRVVILLAKTVLIDHILS